MTSRQPWTDEQINGLITLYPNCNAKKVSAEIGRSEKSVLAKAHKLGLVKSDEFWKACASENLHAFGGQSRFKKGLIPWNKGLKGCFSGDKNTQFQLRNTPHTWRPVGAYRVCSDGYLHVKWRDGGGPRKLHWKPVHRLVWEAYHGLIPPGMLIVFKPGTKSSQVENIRIQNLECITRRESARRNHPLSKSPELAKLVQLKGAITRQVNRITKEQRHE